uniref:NADH-ubiquinone oxidoreductase chain 3 n=1 Tax=Unionicola parkeri TaxID=350891 RepID=E3W3M1_9ACAR|nr:NADH dehydrogenase subunit 3 [Unionicola parkeri]ADP01831.1 NADH dehydrogenase subunit 3 [Unionicola parkeri]
MIMSTTLTWFMMNLSKILKESEDKKKEKSSGFECGFDFQSTKNTPYSSQFFMIAILFIIFDMEISLFIPFMKYQENSTSKLWNMTMIILMLISSTLLEWKMGMIEWSK